MTRVAFRGVLSPFMIAVLALFLVACGSESTSTPTTPTPATSTDTFTATMDQLGSVTHPFTVAATGPVQIGLTSVEPLATMALGVSITAGGASCGNAIAQNTNARSGTTALSGTATPGSYCVRVFDAGNIPAASSVTYTIEVTHP